jgi:hypothetical protein
MPPRAEARIDGREVFVIDDVVSGNRLAHLMTYFDFAPATRIESDSADPDQPRSWIVPIDNDVALKQPYYDAITEQVQVLFPNDAFTLKRAYCNVVSAGDVLLPHRDSRNPDDVTAMLYVAEEWDRAWGGETIFYDAQGDAAYAVSPRPGRLVAFRAGIEHRGTPPSRLCTRPRLTLVLKLAAC